MNNGKIVTVTLNPSLDKTLLTHHLNIGYHNRVADTTHLDASGRGINVSRAADRLGVPTRAIVLLGSDAIGHAYRGLLAEESFSTTFIVQQGPTRSDTIIVDRGNATETHIIDEGSGGSPDDIQRVIENLQDALGPEDTVVLAGVLPREAAPDTYRQMADAVQAVGARVVVMTTSDGLGQVLKAQPDFVTLMRLEAESLFNYPVRTDADMISGCQKLRALGAANVMMVADDYSRVVLLDGENILTAEVAETGPGTDSGVVDALLAGYLAAQLLGQPTEEALRTGAAAMNYADSQIGNVFGSFDEIRQNLHRVDVHQVETNENTTPTP
ncbi:MAG: hypothetical protein K8J31_17015 [Anaerolineae bacterium]|nr:hypothetical protein [Anaerolineae bacterium]